MPTLCADSRRQHDDNRAAERVDDRRIVGGTNSACWCASQQADRLKLVAHDSASMRALEPTRIVCIRFVQRALICLWHVFAEHLKISPPIGEKSAGVGLFKWPQSIVGTGARFVRSRLSRPPSLAALGAEIAAARPGTPSME